VAAGGVMTGQKVPARRCSWHHCSQPAAATVAFELPNLLADSRRDYCADHTSQVCMARGTVLVARFGAQQPSSRAWAAAQPLVGRPRQGGAAGRG
jgi:hypothetical protein